MKVCKWICSFCWFCAALMCTSCGSICYSCPQNKGTKTKALHTVVIDAGHGGYDIGARYYGNDEKTLSLKTAHFLRRHLLAKGYRVVLTRGRDEYIPLKKRVEIANHNRCQALVSIHFNSAKNKDAQGIEVFYYKKAEGLRQRLSKVLADSVLNGAVGVTHALSRGIKEGNFCVIREAKMPAILIEGGFMTNDTERRKLQNENYLNELAKGVADGLDVYFANM